MSDCYDLEKSYKYSALFELNNRESIESIFNDIQNKEDEMRLDDDLIPSETEMGLQIFSKTKQLKFNFMLKGYQLNPLSGETRKFRTMYPVLVTFF